MPPKSAKGTPSPKGSPPVTPGTPQSGDKRIIRIEFVEIAALEYKMQQIDVNIPMRQIAADITDHCRLAQETRKPRRGLPPKIEFREGAFGLFIKKANKLEWLGDKHTLKEFGIKDRATLYFMPVLRADQVSQQIERLRFVDNFGRVINFIGRHVVEIPEDIEKTCQERVLDIDFSDNFISRIPKNIGKLNKLENLILNNNRIAHIPEEIAGCVSLRKLSLQNNRLVDVPSSIGSLKNLETLNLRQNRLKKLPLELGMLSEHRLVDLMTFGNPLEDPPPQIMGMGLQRILRYLNDNRGVPPPTE